MPALTKRILLALLVLSMTAPARAQLNNSIFSDHHPYPSDSARFSASLTGLSYLRDLEYFNDYADGETLFGQQLLARGGVTLGRNVYLTGGAMLQKDFGAPRVQVKPIFTFRYDKAQEVAWAPEVTTYGADSTSSLITLSVFTRRFSILFGTLEGNVQHGQVEPMMDFQSILNRRLEEGFQIKYQSLHTWLDVWLDWQKMIYRYSPEQEQIQAGFTFWQDLLPATQGISLKFLGQGRIFHKGGQLDTTRNKPALATLYMGAGGLRLGHYTAKRQFWLEGLGFAGGGFSENPLFPKQAQQGRAVLATAAFAVPTQAETSWRGITLMANYWQARDFYVPGGASIYQSVSGRIGTESQLISRNRRLAIGRLFWERQLAGAFWEANRAASSLRLETFTDLDTKKTDLALSLYLIFRVGTGKGVSY